MVFNFNPGLLLSDNWCNFLDFRSWRSQVANVVIDIGAATQLRSLWYSLLCTGSTITSDSSTGFKKCLSFILLLIIYEKGSQI